LLRGEGPSRFRELGALARAREVFMLMLFVGSRHASFLRFGCDFRLGAKTKTGLW